MDIFWNHQDNYSQVHVLQFFEFTLYKLYATCKYFLPLYLIFMIHDSWIIHELMDNSCTCTVAILSWKLMTVEVQI